MGKHVFVQHDTHVMNDEQRIRSYFEQKLQEAKYSVNEEIIVIHSQNVEKNVESFGQMYVNVIDWLLRTQQLPQFEKNKSKAIENKKIKFMLKLF